MPLRETTDGETYAELASAQLGEDDPCGGRYDEQHNDGDDDGACRVDHGGHLLYAPLEAVTEMEAMTRRRWRWEMEMGVRSGG